MYNLANHRPIHFCPLTVQRCVEKKKPHSPPPCSWHYLNIIMSKNHRQNPFVFLLTNFHQKFSPTKSPNFSLIDISRCSSHPSQSATFWLEVDDFFPPHYLALGLSYFKRSVHWSRDKSFSAFDVSQKQIDFRCSPYARMTATFKFCRKKKIFFHLCSTCAR